MTESADILNKDLNRKNAQARDNVETGAMNDDTMIDASVPLLFSCRCESARAVSTLLSCLRQVHSYSTSSTASDRATSYSHSSLMSQAASRRGGRYGGDVTLSLSETGMNAKGSKTQYANVFVSPDALTFHVQGFAKQSQASVQLQAGLFSEYHVGSFSLPPLPLSDSQKSITPTAEPHKTENEIIHGGEFCINLTSVLECLHILGTSNLERTTLCLSYDRSSAIFKIELLEENTFGVHDNGSSLLSTCAIPGMAVPDDEDDDSDTDTPHGSTSLAIAFRNSEIVARAIVSSSYIRPAIHELIDLPGASCCTIGLSPDGIEMGAVGYHGECLVSLPASSNNSMMENDGTDDTPAFISLECNPPNLHKRSYPLHSFIQGMRGLEVANETCISMNESGMIAIQHQVLDKVGKGEPNFVDFIMGAIQDDEDEYDDDGDDDDDDNDDDDREVNEQGYCGTQQNLNGHQNSSFSLDNEDNNDNNFERSGSKFMLDIDYNDNKKLSTTKPTRKQRRILESPESTPSQSSRLNTKVQEVRKRNRREVQNSIDEKYSNESSEDDSNSSNSTEYKHQRSISSEQKSKLAREIRLSSKIKSSNKEKDEVRIQMLDSQNDHVDKQSKTKIQCVPPSSNNNDEEFRDPKKSVHGEYDYDSHAEIGLNDEGMTSSPELLFGDTRLAPTPSPHALQRSSRQKRRGTKTLGAKSNDSGLLFSSASRKRRHKARLGDKNIYNYSDDDTDEDEF